MPPTAVGGVDDVGSVDCYKLYGYNWDHCGYCRGSRASFNIALPGDDHQQQQQQQQQKQLPEQLQQQQQQQDAAADDAVPTPPIVSSTAPSHSRSSNGTYRSYLTKLESPLRPSSYEALMCRGWRRSGTIVYLPDNAITCCPQHTIRLPVDDFALNKDQRKVLRKIESLSLVVNSSNNSSNNDPPKKHHLKNAVMAFLARNGVIASLANETETHLASLLQERDCKMEDIPSVRYKLHGFTNDGGRTNIAALSCPVCTALVSRKLIEKQAAPDLASRLVKRMQSSQSLSSEVVASISFTTAGILRVVVNVPDEALADHRSLTTSATTVNGGSGTDSASRRRIDPLAAWFQSKGMPVPSDRSIQIQTLPATESAATDPRVHQLYWDYQEAVHGDEHPLKSASSSSSSISSVMAPSTTAASTTTITSDVHCGHQKGSSSTATVDARALPMLQQTYSGSSSSSSSSGQSIPWHAFASFWDFLVDSPLGASTVHQLYTIGDALVAVGVLDILPTAVSSVYCFYDPTFSKLVPLGTYTAVREIEYTRSLQRSYYYLGYYIESNPKMNYKGDYIGSQVRCTATGQWVGVDDARKVLRHNERARLGSETHPTATLTNAMVDVGSLPILTNQGIIYGNILQDEDKEHFYPFLEQWVALVGPDVALTATVDIRE